MSNQTIEGYEKGGGKCRSRTSLLPKIKQGPLKIVPRIVPAIVPSIAVDSTDNLARGHSRAPKVPTPNKPSLANRYPAICPSDKAKSSQRSGASRLRHIYEKLTRENAQQNKAGVTRGNLSTFSFSREGMVFARALCATTREQSL
jgi:hypothetical protein